MLIAHSFPQKLEHFIASFNALMEHTAHVEQQLHLDQDAADVETAEEFLARHMQIQDQLKKAPQNTIREGNELLRALEQVGYYLSCSDIPLTIGELFLCLASSSPSSLLLLLNFCTGD